METPAQNSTSTAEVKLSSASAGFTESDIGKSVSGGPFAAGVYILSRIPAGPGPPTTQVTLAAQTGNPIQADCTKTNGGNLNAVPIVVPQDSSSPAGADSIEIGTDTYNIAGANEPKLFPGTDLMSAAGTNDVVLPLRSHLGFRQRSLRARSTRRRTV